MKKSINSLVVIFFVFLLCISMVIYNQIYLQKYFKKNLDFHFRRSIDINEQNLIKILERDKKILELYKEIVANIHVTNTCADNSDVNKVEYTNKYIVAQMYQMLKDVHDLFEKNKIEYWANAGTLLGAIRHKGIIPWDDDIDISVHEEDVARIKSLEIQLKDLGYEIVTGPWQKIQPLNGFIVSTSMMLDNLWDKTMKFPSIDIFPSKREKDEYIHASSIPLSAFPKEKCSIESLKNKKLVNFGNFKIWVTGDAESEIKYIYGDDALTHAVWQGTHSEPMPPYKWKLEGADKLPAEPFDLTIDRVE